MSAAQPVFDDEIVTATALNRNSGKILDRALNKPLTIMRNDEAFALLSRQAAARLVAESTHASRMVEFSIAVCFRCMGQKLQQGHRYEWVNAFDGEDTRQMLGELMEAFNKARDGEDTWDEFEAVLHEWRESAAAIRSGLHERIRMESGAEVPLSEPLEVAPED